MPPRRDDVDAGESGDRPRTRRVGPGPLALLRGRFKTVALVVVTLWLCVAVTVVFVRGFSNAERSGTAEEAAAQYQENLGHGWFPLELAPLSTPPGWLGINYSRGTFSTVKPAPWWSSLRLRLAPIGCSDGHRLSISVRQGTRVLGTLVPTAGWSWFRIRLVEKGQPVTLRYSCVTLRPGPIGAGRARLAVLLSGVTG